MSRLIVTLVIAVSILVSGVAVVCAKSFPASASAAASAPTEHDKWQKDFDGWEKKTYEAAKAEGKVVWYTCEPPALTDILVKEFPEKYPGLEVEFLYGRGGAHSAKIRAEQDAEQVSADVFTVSIVPLRRLATEGRAERFIPPYAVEPGVEWKIDPLGDEQYFPHGGFPVYIGMTATGMIINTDLVPPDKKPKFYKDLFDPWWKGKIISHDPRISGWGNSQWYIIKKFYGEEGWAKLAAQEPVFETSYDIAARAVATGEYAVAIGMKPLQMVPLKGGPIEYILAVEGAAVSQNSAILVKGAPHPNAAKLFINLQLSKEWQNAYGSTGARTPILPGCELLIPELSVEGAKLYVPTFEEDTKIKPQAREDVKKHIGG